MRILQTTTLIVLTALFAGLSICEPSYLSSNKFLDEFVNQQYINILAVIVTVSLVSVIQIHLEYSRVERRFKTRVFGDSRRTVNVGALILTGLLVAAFIISFMKADLSSTPVAISLLHGAALLTVLTAIFIMYDFVRIVYVLASEEPIEEGESDK